jgi:hypothetical protein
MQRKLTKPVQVQKVLLDYPIDKESLFTEKESLLVA